MAERRDCKDFVSIFVCSDWQLLRVRLADGAVRGAFWEPPGALGAARRNATSRPAGGVPRVLQVTPAG